MKERITKNGIDYVLIGDYYIPDLKLPALDLSCRYKRAGTKEITSYYQKVTPPPVHNG